MQKALIQMNLHLHKVISDITGHTSMAIIRAIAAGVHDPQALADLKDPRIKSSTADIAKALTGDYRLEHLFVLKQELTLYEVYQKEIATIDKQIEKCLADFEPKTLDELTASKKKRRKKSTANHPDFDLRKYLYRMAGVDFTLIDGLDALTVQTILSEVGLDPERFPTVKHFSSWLGLSPGQKITGGKVKSSRDPPSCQPRRKRFSDGSFFSLLKVVLLWVLFIGVYDRDWVPPKRLLPRHTLLARMFYRMWTDAGQYIDPGMDYYEQQYQEQVLNNLRKKAQSLGFDLVAQSNPTECVS